jgi:hypothetical protein
MKRVLLINLTVLMALCCGMYSACKKPQHLDHPTPSNNRLLSYTKFSTSTLGGLPVNENFTFFYDGQKRVSQILYTTNDTFKIVANAANLKIDFAYSNDTIFKTTTAETSMIVIERDTFIQNTYGQITTAFTPGNINTYNYFGALIAGDSRSVYDSGTIISSGTTYTSDNGDLLIRSNDGTLHASFPDSGLTDLFGDGVLTTAFLVDTVNVFWTDLVTGKITEHKMVIGYNDVFTGYTNGDPMAIQIYDTSILALSPYIPVIAYDTLIWPARTIWPQEKYFVYPTLLNRPGDYFQIESFTTYGVNVYQNAHLIRQIVDQNGPTTNISYTIDADSKITQTYVTKRYPDSTVYTTVYKLQYEVF